MTLMTKDGVTWDIAQEQIQKHLHHGWVFVDEANQAGEDIIRLKPATVLTRSTVTDLEQATTSNKGDE